MNSKTAFILPLILLYATGSPAPLQAEQLKGGVQHEEQKSPLFDRLDAQSDDLLNPQISLPAGVNFEETVLPASAELKAHKLFSSIKMPAEDNEDTWYKIPAWRAGEFHREKQIDHTRGGDLETVSRADHVYGMQLDKNGGIWHHMSWPKVTKVSSEQEVQYKIVNRYEPVSVNDDEFCVKISSTNVFVDEKTGKITRTSKQEEIDRYFPAGQGKARGECLIQGYSHHGRKNTLVQCCTVEEDLVKPFAVINSFRGKNLRESFCNYLRAKKLEQLIPDN